MTRRNAEILLAAVIIARSSSYVLTKIGLTGMEPLTLLGERFLLAFVLLAVFFGRRFRAVSRSTVLYGALLGFLTALVMRFELLGLQTTSSSTTAFLENTAVVFVPLLGIVFYRKLPSMQAVFGTGIIFAGIGFLTLHGSQLSLTAGELYCLLAALLYALTILATGYYAKRTEAFLLGIFQVGFVGVFCMLGAVVFETPRLPQGVTEWGVIVLLAVICTAFGFTLQPLAQRYTTAQRTGNLCALNPLFASVLGMVVLGETFSLQGAVGAALILAGLLLSNHQKENVDGNETRAVVQEPLRQN